MHYYLSRLSFMSACFFLLTAIVCLTTPGPVQGQTLSDLTNDINQFGQVNPGIVCKTRTNNEATVRNLAHGVKNRDSNTAVALNCGFPTPLPWVFNWFPNSARVEGEIDVVFARDPGVSNTVFSQSYCMFNVSGLFNEDQNPNGSLSAINLGQATPGNFGPLSDELVIIDFISTQGITYPSDYNFISAYCRLTRGVRLQAIILNGWEVGSF